MKSLLSVRLLYVLAALYDGLLGLMFIVAAPQVFQWAGIVPPNHWGYVHFAAGLLVIFAFLFLQVARHPVINRGLIVYGILLKICYIATIGWHSVDAGLPMLWKWFAVADAGFILLFFWSMMLLENMPHAAERN